MYKYGTAQRQLDACMQAAGSLPKGHISTARYGHVGARWDFSHVEQSLPVMSAGCLRIPPHVVNYQAYFA